MFLRCSTRKKAGKIHRYWSIVENRRVCGDRIVQRHVCYLGEINSAQRERWQKSIEVFEDGCQRPKNLMLLAEEVEQPKASEAAKDAQPQAKAEPAEAEGNAKETPPAGQAQPAKAEGSAAGAEAKAEPLEVVRLRVAQMTLCRPRQWGGCWLACHLYAQLGLDRFFAERLPPSRKGTRWDLILQTLCAYRLLDPGSEWRLHRHWFEHSAMADLLGADFSLAESHKLYTCHDRLLDHKDQLFSHLQERWKDLFGARFEVLLYDLTSTYFESDPPEQEGGKRRFGYSRDKRSDCVQVVIALVVTPDGFPLAYEVLAGNTSDKTTLRSFLERIEKQYGKAERIWVMDRGIPTEEVLAEMRASTPPISYLVGTPKARLSKLEADLAKRPWQQVRENIEVKLLPQEQELYVFAQSRARIDKERSMRRRRLRRLLERLAELRAMKKLQRDELLMKIGQARAEAGRVFGLIDLQLPKPREAVNEETFRFALNRAKLRIVRRREGRYLLRSNLCAEDPAKLWQFYIQLTQVEEAFKTLKGDLSIRPIYHQRDERIEAHIFIAFLAYCVQVTLSRRLRDLAPGLTARAVLEKFAAVMMLDVHVPTSDGREVIFTRYTQPENDLRLLLAQLKLELPTQAPPKITAKDFASKPAL